ncbi:hypothetical protein ACLKA6_005418 [Drosophila palustris]
MAQVTETGVKDQNTQRDHIGDDEVSELQKSPLSFYQKVREQAERFACTRFGQFAIERADRGLELIENTTKWSLPQDKNSSAVVLERPLPWVPFLLLIIVLRLARIWLSLGALMIGNGPVSPADMIYFIQTRRRKLRAIRVHGLRVMRLRQQEATSSGAKSFIQQLSQWLSRAICRPGVQRANSGRVQFSAQQQPNHQVQSVSKRSRDEDAAVEHNLTIDEMLNKYANENSEDDSDFVPNAEDESESSCSDSSNSNSNSSDDFSSNEEEENVEKYKSNNGVQHNKSESQLDKDKNKDKTKEKEKEKDQEKPTKTTTTTTTTKSNGSNDKKPPTETEVAHRVDAVKEEEWKSTPGHMSAALKTSLYNNTAAAANIDQLQSNSNSNSNSTSHPDNNNLDSNCDNDIDSEIDTDDMATTIISESESNQQIHSTIETLTPATSSEDIFYSPIGSPNNFNSCFSPMSPLHNATINSVTTHSTPHSELEEEHSAASDLEEATRLSISLAHQGVYLDTPPQAHSQKQPQQSQQPQPQPHQQQQQRQFNHQSHQRFRGRNRR